MADGTTCGTAGCCSTSRAGWVDAGGRAVKRVLEGGYKRARSGMAARSTRWPKACCPSRWAKRPSWPDECSMPARSTTSLSFGSKPCSIPRRGGPTSTVPTGEDRGHPAQFTGAIEQASAYSASRLTENVPMTARGRARSGDEAARDDHPLARHPRNEPRPSPCAPMSPGTYIRSLQDIARPLDLGHVTTSGASRLALSDSRRFRWT